MKKLSNNTRKKRVIIVLSACVLAVLCAVFIIADRTEEEPIESEDDTRSISIYDLSVNQSDMIILDGAVESKNISTIVTDITASVSDLYVSVGDFVKNGDVLCRFDTAEIESEIAALEKEEQSALEQERVTHDENQRELQNAVDDKDRQLAKANENIASAQSEIENLKSKSEAAKILYTEALSQDSLISDSKAEDDTESADEYTEKSSAEDYANEIEELDNELISLEKELKEYKEAYADIELECNRAIQDCIDLINEEVSEAGQNSDELARLKAQIDKAVVTAPQDGIITTVNVSAGAPASEECIVKIADMNSAIVKVLIPEQNIFSIYEGMPALVSIPPAGGKTVKGYIWKLIMVPVSDEETAENFYEAYIDVSGNDVNWVYGMNVEAALTSSDRTYIYDIPNEYIFEEENGEYVFIAKENSDNEFTVEKQYIVKGNEYPDKDSSEIYFDGINANTKIIKSDDAEAEIYDGEILPGEYFSDSDMIMDSTEYLPAEDGV